MKNTEKLSLDMLEKIAATNRNFADIHVAREWARRAYDFEGVAAVEILRDLKHLDSDGNLAFDREDLANLMENFIGCYEDKGDFARKWLYRKEVKFLKLSDEILEYLDDEKVGQDILISDRNHSSLNGGQYYYHTDDDGMLYVFHRLDRSFVLNWMNRSRR